MQYDLTVTCHVRGGSVSKRGASQGPRHPDFSMTSRGNSVQLVTLQDKKTALGRWRVAMKAPIARKLCVPGQSQVPLSPDWRPSGQCVLT